MISPYNSGSYTLARHLSVVFALKDKYFLTDKFDRAAFKVIIYKLLIRVASWE